jgi:hypothetical protein
VEAGCARVFRHAPRVAALFSTRFRALPHRAGVRIPHAAPSPDDLLRHTSMGVGTTLFCEMVRQADRALEGELRRGIPEKGPGLRGYLFSEDSAAQASFPGAPKLR